MAQTPAALDELRQPGPARAAALGAAAGSLQMDLAVCGDRGRAIATRMLDRAIAAAQEVVDGRR